MQGAAPSTGHFETGVKKFTVLLLLLIGLLQYRLWLGDGSIRDLNRLKGQIEEMQQEGAKRRDRNVAQEAEVMDLKQGTDAIEELARQDLGMIKEGEVFVQVLEQHQPLPPPAASGKIGGKPVPKDEPQKRKSRRHPTPSPEPQVTPKDPAEPETQP